MKYFTQYFLFILILNIAITFEASAYDGVKTEFRQQIDDPSVPRATLVTDLKWIEGGVERHNHYRNLHGVPLLKLNLTVCEISQFWANQGARAAAGHNPDRGPTGENIFGRCVFRDKLDVNSSYPVDGWYNEVRFYDYENGVSTVPNEVVGHFTQVVWNGTLEVGMASFEYRDFRDSKEWDCLVVVANYYPPGNVRGSFVQNVFRSTSKGSTLSFQCLFVFPIFSFSILQYWLF